MSNLSTLGTLLVVAFLTGCAAIGGRHTTTQHSFDSAGDAFPNRDLDPRVSCSGPLRVAVLRSLTEFRLAHWVAWQLYSHGQRDVLFPPGTYWMREAYRVTCRPLDAFPTPRRYTLAA